MDQSTQIGIVGAGAWGTALATVAARNGHSVAIWDPDHEIIETINREHRHPRALEGVALDKKIVGKESVEEAARAPLVLMAVPAQSMRSAMGTLAPYVRPGTILVICAKGIEIETGALMSEIVTTHAPQTTVAALSGPTFADEVAHGLPTAVTVATNEATAGEKIVRALGSKGFRPYLSDDLVGTQVGGAVKNVLAIACGITHGLALGDNARSAVITRGIVEIGRLSLVLGGKSETLMGLSGIGDLVLTCTSEQSRNYSFGRYLGSGHTLENVPGRSSTTIEGVATAASVTNLSSRHELEMPISNAVNSVLHHGADVRDEISALLARPFRDELTL